MDDDVAKATKKSAMDGEFDGSFFNSAMSSVIGEGRRNASASWGSGVQRRVPEVTINSDSDVGVGGDDSDSEAPGRRPTKQTPVKSNRKPRLAFPFPEAKKPTHA